MSESQQTPRSKPTARTNRETPLGERCHIRTFLEGVNSHQNSCPSVAPLSEWCMSESQQTPSSKSHARPMQKHLSERGATFGSFLEGVNSHQNSCPSVAPLSEWCSQNHTNLQVAQTEHLSREVPFGSSRESRRCPVWHHSPSGQSDTALQASWPKHLSERGATFGAFLEGVNSSPEQLSQCGTTLRVVHVRITTSLQAPSRTLDRFENTSRREVPHSERFSKGSTLTEQAVPVWHHSPSGPCQNHNKPPSSKPTLTD